MASETSIIYEGDGHVPCNLSQLDSLWSESMGMLHALTVMGKLLEQTQYNGMVILASENLELIKRTKKTLLSIYNVITICFTL